MIKKIILHNFMSHAHSEITLSPGLTVLSGANNCGKSAVTVALDVLCNNASGDFMVRHSEKECYVTLELNQNDVITWRRSSGVTTYEINGREVGRLRGGVPDSLHEMVRMPPVDQFELHLAHQKAPIFLLDQPGSRAAQFFANSSDAEKLLQMQKRHRQKVREANQELNRREREIEQLRGRYNVLLSIDDLAYRARESVEQRDAIEILTRKQKTLADLLVRMEQAEAGRDRTDVEARLFSSLFAPPRLGASEPLRAYLAELEGVTGDREAARTIQRTLSPLADPPSIHNTTKLEKLIRAIENAQGRCIASDREIEQLGKLRRVPQIEGSAPRRAFIRQFVQARDECYVATRRTERLATLAPPPQLSTTEPLRDRIDLLQREGYLLVSVTEESETLNAIRPPPPGRESARLTRSIAQIHDAEQELVRYCEELDQLAGALGALVTNSGERGALERSIASEWRNERASASIPLLRPTGVPSADALDEQIRRLELERQHLVDAINELDESIQLSQRELLHLRERLVSVTDALTALRADQSNVDE